MSLNATQSEQTQRAIVELAFKKRLEAKFRIELDRLFRAIASDLSKTLQATGGVVSANAYSGRLKVIMDTNYKRVQRKFTDEIFTFLKRNARNLDEQIIVELTAIAEARGIKVNKLIADMKKNVRSQLQSFRDFNVGQSVSIITQTTQKEITRAVTKANQALIEELGDDPTNGQLAAKTRKNFLGRQRSRAQMIAATETQKVAEGTKQIERDNLLSIRNSSTANELELRPIDANEIWVTQADSLVRDGDGTIFNHLAADGQIKEAGFFTVSGESLRFPGDVSLGASPGNVINCRCSAVTVIE